MKIPSSRVTRWAMFGVAALCTVTVGAIAVILFLHPFAPSAVAPASAAVEISVVTQPFNDPRNVQITLDRGPDRLLLSQAEGRVTALGCVIGGSIASGSSPVSIDGVPRLGLATAIPLWRDLPRGAQGSDVNALHSELTRLGYDVAGDGPAVGSATLGAVADALKKIGSDPSDRNTVPLRLLVWVPDLSARVTGCGVTVGQQISSGATLASFAPALAGAHITTVPDRLIAGARSLVVAGNGIAVDASGAITSGDALGALAGTPEYAKAAADSTNPGIDAIYRLVDTVAVAVVPPSAVVGSSGNQCVVSGTSTIGVTVVGSQLGQTYVTFDGKAPSAVTIKPAASVRCK